MTTKLPVIKAHISMANIRQLETMFAKLTPTGWVIPEWIFVLKQARKTGGPVLTYSTYLSTLNELREALGTKRVSGEESMQYYDEWCRWKTVDRLWAYQNISSQLIIARG